MKYMASRMYVRVVSLLFWLVPVLAYADGLLPHTHYKYRVVFSVCQRIAAAQGDVRRMPGIEVNSRASHSRKIAYVKLQPLPVIYVDEQVYDLCGRFGRDSLNALACLIGHELAHYYQNHSWTNSFADLTDSLASSSTDTPSIDKARLEAEADYFGLFYGFLAGYETFRLLPQTLNAIYRQYKLPEQVPDYPSQKDRIRLAQEKVREIMPLISVFRAGELLYLRQNYQEAAVCFDYLLAKYPSREVYNNAGVVKLAQSLQLLDAEQLYFAYPFELDARTRLQQGTPRTGEDSSVRQRKAEALLVQAQNHFEKALIVDPSYTPGYVNLACVYSLLDNQEAAIGKIKELERVLAPMNAPLPGNAHLVKGIALVKNDQLEHARADFERALSKGAYCAEYNMALYKKLSSTWQDKLGDWLTNWPVVEGWIQKFWGERKESKNLVPEKGMNAGTPVASGDTQEGSPIRIADENYPIKIVASQTNQVQKLSISLKEYQLQVLTTEQNYAGKTGLGVGIGTGLSEVIKRYGEPNYSTAGAANHHYYCYHQARIILEVAGGYC